MSRYLVMVDDNFHYMDESERHTHAAYDTCEAAVAACRRIVDEFLARSHRSGMTAGELYDQYSSFGEDPFIAGDAGGKFSAHDYAKQRCAEICGRD